MRLARLVIAIMLFCLGINQQSFGQRNVIDSLKGLLAKTDKDSLKAIYYNKIGKEFWYINADSSFFYTQFAFNIATKKNIKGVFPYCYNNFGVLEYLQGNYSNSLKKYFEGLKYSDNNLLIKGILLNNIGMNYTELKDYQKAQEYYQKTLSLKKTMGDSSRLATTYINIGIIFNCLHQPEIGKLYFDTTLVLVQKFPDYYSEADALGNIANYHFKKKNHLEAEKYCRKAIAIKKRLEDSYGTTTSYSDLGAILLDAKKPKESEEALKFAEAIALKENYKDALLPIYQNFSQLYEFKEDYKRSLFYLNKTISLKDSLLSDGNVRDAAVKEKEYLHGVAQVKDSLKNENEKIQTNLLHEKEMYKQKLYSYGGIIGFVVMLLVAIVVFKAYREKQKANSIIAAQKQVVEQQKHEVEEHRKEILDSIHYAKRIQDTLLAHHDFLDENVPNNFVLFKPKDIVSGDFYWATKHGNKFYLAVCDSTGHGVPGAFMSLLNIGFLSEAINEKNILEPHKIFDYVRQRLTTSVSKDGQKDGFDGILLCIDKELNTVSYAAAHNAPLLISKGEIIELSKDKMPVGVGERKEEFKLYTLNMTEADILYLYTDGYADQFGGPKGKKFKYKPLNELLVYISEKPMSDQLNILDQNFENWRGDLEQVDDVCVIGIRI